MSMTRVFDARTLRPGDTYAASDLPESTTRERDQISAALQANLDRGFLESEERFRQIVEGLHHVVWLTNANATKVYFVNAAYEDIWGDRRAAMYADPLAFLARVHPEDRDRVQAALLSHSAGDHDLEYRVVPPSGEVRWVWSRGYPVLDREGRLHRVGTIVEDITDRRRIVESHERLVRGFTHDIKNPLGAADGYMALLEMGIHGAMNEAQAESIRRARGALRSALTLVTQLLEIERAQSGQLSVRNAVTDIEEVTRDTVGEFRSAARAKTIDMEFLPRRVADSLIVETDGALVRQILANLVSNAVKYTQAGGHISVRAHMASDSQAPWPGRWISVEVADDGPGIPVSKQGLLFREFTRFDPTAAEGTGIGLAISQRLAIALGATITFVSTPGVGSAFTLWIPVERAPAHSS